MKSSDEMPENGGIEPDGEEHARILIAYFTWAENTYVENPEAVDVDATTSASVLPPGPGFPKLVVHCTDGSPHFFGGV